MNIPMTDFRRSDDNARIACGKCNSNVVQHQVSSDGCFIGAWFHCVNYKCEQSYSAERNKLWKHIRILEKEIEELKND